MFSNAKSTGRTQLGVPLLLLGTNKSFNIKSYDETFLVIVYQTFIKVTIKNKYIKTKENKISSIYGKYKLVTTINKHAVLNSYNLYRVTFPVLFQYNPVTHYGIIILI